MALGTHESTRKARKVKAVGFDTPNCIVVSESHMMRPYDVQHDAIFYTVFIVIDILMEIWNTILMNDGCICIDLDPVEASNNGLAPQVQGHRAGQRQSP